MSSGYDLEPYYAGLVDSQGEEDKQAFMVAFFKAEQKLRVRRTRSATPRKEKRADRSSYSPKEDMYFSPRMYSETYLKDHLNFLSCPVPFLKWNNLGTKDNYFSP